MVGNVPALELGGMVARLTLRIGTVFWSTGLLAAWVPAWSQAAGELLLPGLPTEHRLAAEESHLYHVEAGTMPMLVVVEQQGVDLRLEVVGSAGAEPLAVGSPIGSWGPEALLLPASDERTAQLVLRSAETAAAAGRYTIAVEVLDDAAPAGAQRRAGFAAMSRAGQLAAGLPATHQKALPLYREALEIWRALAERRWQAEAQLAIAVIEHQAANLKTAILTYRQALALFRELGVPHRVADVLDRLSLALQRAGDFATARTESEHALALWQSLGESAQAQGTRNTLCLLDLSTGALASARACFEELLVLRREQGDPRGEALALANVGGVYDLMGEPDTALERYGEALALWQQLGDPAEEARTLKNMGVVYRAVGAWQEALGVYDRAREILAQHPDPIQEATLYNNVGYAYNSLGEPERALPWLERSLALRGQQGQLWGEIATLNSLGTTWCELGDFDQSLAHHRRALERALSLGDAQQEALSRLGLGRVLLERGESAAAGHELETALAHFRAKGLRGREAQALQLQGRALAEGGRPAEALPLLEEVLERQRTLRDRAGEAETLAALARVERALGRLEPARRHAEQAVARVEALRTGVLSPELRAAFLATRRRVYELAIDLLMAHHLREPEAGHHRAAFALSEQARARTLLDVLQPGGEGQDGGAPAELLERRRSLRRRLSVRAARQVTQTGADKGEALEREMEALLGELDGVEAEIRRHDRRYAAFSAPPSIDLEQVAGLLDPGTVLIEIALGEPRSFLWAVSAAGLHSFVLPARREVEPLVRRVYERLSTVEVGVTDRGRDAEALARLLLAPAWGELGGADRLVVVADGALHWVPFAALPVPPPGQGWESAQRAPLLERLEIVALPSATTLALQRQRPARRSSASKWAAVLADPVFSRDDPRLAGAAPPVQIAAAHDPWRSAGASAVLPSFERLPASRREAEAIAALSPAGQARIELDFAANRDTVVSGELSEYRVVHFATHGIADTRNPELSGLVFSLLDAAGRSREGFLALGDVYELDLAAELVVLSGCRTALGKEVNGEGLMGLTRGFLYAGVPRVVASLWPVKDRTTAELMSLFYRAMWQDGLAPAAALRAAQRALRQDRRYRDPYSWAGFVLHGDWRGQ